MSNFNFKAKNKRTGEIVQVTAFDDYFGRREYGYEVDHQVMSEEVFDNFYEVIQE